MNEVSHIKKLLCITVLIILTTFCIPIIFTHKFRNTAAIDLQENDENNDVKNTDENNVNEEYSYREYSRIKLLHVKDNYTVEDINLDDYLLGVVSAEMPASFEQEALKAQAVVARTYTLYCIKHNNGKHNGADICDDSTCCQAWISKENRMEKWDEKERDNYWKKIENAVIDTKGKVITYNGEVIDAFFHSNSGGKTENVSTVWGGADLPYLQSVETSGEDGYTQFQSEVVLSKEEFTEKIKSKHKDFEIDFSDSECIKILEYTEGNRVKTIKIGNLELSGVEVRTLVGLKSANFTVEMVNDEIKFSVNGYGHGVGMSQTGADSLAKQGKNYEEIIKHFYTGVEIINF